MKVRTQGSNLFRYFFLGVYMRKRFTTIICACVAAVSIFGAAFSSGCSSFKGVDTKDESAANVSSNGGFVVETGDYAYFINGSATYTDDNKYGEVLKGSVQRIKKTDLAAHNYTATETVVPSVVYSGQYDAGIYIYGDYIYYTTPTTEKDADGNVLNSNLDFKRTKLDGTETTKKYFWQSSSNSVDYRYVQVDGTVYILYALSETLYNDTSATNIHSVNCETGVDTLLAYNVSAYTFDTEDATNPWVYYTMAVTWQLGTDNSAEQSYNQLYRVRADDTTANTYDFSYIEDYYEQDEDDDDYDPVYINYGDLVLDGVGIKGDEPTQFSNITTLDGITYDGYTYSVTAYQNDVLYFTRASILGDESITNIYKIDDASTTIGDSWNEVKANDTLDSNHLFRKTTDADTEYTYVTLNGTTYAFEGGSDGIVKYEVSSDGQLVNEYLVTSDASATILDVREEYTAANDKHTYLYYSISGGNGYYCYRLAIDGSNENYNRFPTDSAAENDEYYAYRGTQILDIDMCSDWYSMEFVGNTLLFASETTGMSDYNYIMACDLSDSDGYMLTNKEIEDYNDKYEAVTEKIEAYDDETNTDGTAAYSNLANALKYLFYTDDMEYLAELIQAYVDLQDKDEEYLYSTESAQIYLDYADVKGDWADYASDSKTVNEETVYANQRDYYYAVVGQITEDDEEAILDGYKEDYMQAYPDDTRSWWEQLSTTNKVLFVVGVSVGGLLVIAGATLLTLWLVKRHKAKKNAESGAKSTVDITDDKSVNVYEDETGAPDTPEKKDE